MAEFITSKQLHEAAGVDDWRVLWSVAFAVFRTGDFADPEGNEVDIATWVGRD